MTSYTMQSFQRPMFSKDQNYLKNRIAFTPPDSVKANRR